MDTQTVPTPDTSLLAHSQFPRTTHQFSHTSSSHTRHITSSTPPVPTRDTSLITHSQFPHPTHDFSHTASCHTRHITPCTQPVPTPDTSLLAHLQFPHATHHFLHTAMLSLRPAVFSLLGNCFSLGGRMQEQKRNRRKGDRP
jgi:hypothetical protein